MKLTPEHKKQITEIFSEARLPQEYIDLFFEEFNPAKDNEERLENHINQKSPLDILDLAFAFDKTSQGEDFWQGVYDFLANPLPRIENIFAKKGELFKDCAIRYDAEKKEFHTAGMGEEYYFPLFAAQMVFDAMPKAPLNEYVSVYEITFANQGEYIKAGCQLIPLAKWTAFAKKIKKLK